MLANNLTKCEVGRLVVLNIGKKDDYLPVCEANGDYKTLQCHGKSGKCWCVDSQGLMFDWAKTNGEDEAYCEKKGS